MQNLREAGTTITASPDQAKRLRVADSEFNNILTVSETEKSSIDEKEIDLGGAVETSDLETKPEGESAEAVTEDAETDTSDEAESENDKLNDHDVQLLGKFVDLCDLLPPLPKKGSFDVETIKSSQYFFS
jgi:DNA-directed RNA polymerase